MGDLVIIYQAKLESLNLETERGQQEIRLDYQFKEMCNNEHKIKIKKISPKLERIWDSQSQQFKYLGVNID